MAMEAPKTLENPVWLNIIKAHISCTSLLIQLFNKLEANPTCNFPENKSFF